MDTLQIKDKKFKRIISSEKIEARVIALAKQIEEDYQNRNPIFISILNGSFVFAATLTQNLTIDCEISFVKLKSYKGLESEGNIKELLGVDVNITNKHIIIVEDIVESGLTTAYLIEKLLPLKPASIEIATLLHKPNKIYLLNHPLKYIAFLIEDEFVVGYGLDYDGLGRNISSIYQLIQE